jgi:hypothetical protein
MMYNYNIQHPTVNHSAAGTFPLDHVFLPYVKYTYLNQATGIYDLL